MAVTQNTYTAASGSLGGPYSYSFPIIADTDLKVSVDGQVKTVTTHYTLDTGNTRITFVSGQEPTVGQVVIVYRDTAEDPINSTFSSGSTIRSNELNENFKQLLYIAQETDNQALSTLSGTMQNNLSFGKGAGLLFEGDTINDNETLVKVVDPTADRTILFPNVSGNVVTTGDTGTVATGMIAANAVTTNKIAGSNITTALINNSAVTDDKIANNSVATAKLQDSSVTTAKIADDSVTTAKLVADCVVGSRIADNAVGAEHIEQLDDHLDFADNKKARFGNGQDLEIYHDSSNSFIRDAGTGGLVLQTGLFEVKNPGNNKFYITAAEDGNVELRHTNSKKFETTSAGAKVSGDLQITGNLVLDTASIGTAEITDANITTAKIADNAVTTAKIADAELSTLADMQSGTASILAGGTALAATLTEINTICDGKGVETTISNDDTKYPTSGAVVDYVAAQIAPIGGLEVIANDASFPEVQPSAGVVISIADAGGLVVNGSGVSTTGRTVASTPATVTINGINSAYNSSTVTNGVGFLVSSTGSGQVYNFHKSVIRDQDILSISSDIDDFANRYRVGSSNPTSNNDAGDLFYNTGTNKLYTYNANNTTWEEAQSVGNFYISTLSPAFDGSTTDFTLTNAPSYASQVILTINGVVQKPNAGTSAPSDGFALDGATVKLGGAPATGSTYSAVVIGSTVNIGAPSDNTISTVKIQNAAVTTDKIADNAITAAKLADNAIASDAQKNTIAGSNAGDSFTGTDANYNSLFGYDAGTAITTGDGNTAVGAYSFDANTTGIENTSVGYNSLSDNTSGNYNVAIGKNALMDNTTAAENTAVGHDSLKLNTTGTRNTAVGYAALDASTTGNDNVAVGQAALSNATTANNNTAVGRSALNANTTGSSNTAIGLNSLLTNTTGQDNISIGVNCSRLNTTGSGNTALGRDALEENTTASYNTAIGYKTLAVNTTGSNLVAVGSYALDSNTTASSNTGVGYAALAACTSGNSHVALGTRALANVVTNNNCTAIGFDALRYSTGSDNTAVGSIALDANTTGDNNTAVGKGALTANTTADNNTAVGYAALGANTTGANGCAFGSYALDANTTGGNNTAFGQFALSANTTGERNVAIGQGTLYVGTTHSNNTAVGNWACQNTTGDNNVGVGSSALYSNTTGAGNTAVGVVALEDNTTGGSNAAFGRYALANNTTASKNTGLGYSTLYLNTTGEENTAVGYIALEENSTGTKNTAVGAHSLEGNTTGWGSVAVGHSALKNHTTGSENTAIGNLALYTNTTGTSNTAVGNEALEVATTGENNVAMGHRAGHALTTGSDNTLIGPWAADTLTTGNDNVCIGINAGAGQITTESGELWIARNNSGAGNDETWIYGTNTGRCYNGDNDSHWYTTSDERLKKDIVDNTIGLSVINQIKVKNFKYKQYKDGSPITADDTVDMSKFPKADNTKQVLIGQGKTETRLGIIAQDLESVLPNSVDISSKGVKTVLTDELFWHMINAIKELSTKVTALEAK